MGVGFQLRAGRGLWTGYKLPRPLPAASLFGTTGASGIAMGYGDGVKT